MGLERCYWMGELGAGWRPVSGCAAAAVCALTDRKIERIGTMTTTPPLVFGATCRWDAACMLAGRWRGQTMGPRDGRIRGRLQTGYGRGGCGVPGLGAFSGGMAGEFFSLPSCSSCREGQRVFSIAGTSPAASFACACGVSVAALLHPRGRGRGLCLPKCRREPGGRVLWRASWGS